MNKIALLKMSLIALIVGCSSCSTTTYTARKVDVLARDLNSTKQAVQVKTDFGKPITATSEYHFFLADAKKEAEFRCLQNNEADVVVDPIYKIEFNIFRFKRHYKATIVGYAGHYEEAQIGVEAAKNYSIEDIEKYKLLTDPEFMHLYYAPREIQPIIESGSKTYNYSFGTSALHGNYDERPAAPVSTMMTNTLPVANKRAATPTFDYDYRKSKKMRDAGIGMFASGLVVFFGLGTTTYCIGAYEAGIAMSVIGGSMTLAGIPMWAVGQKRMNKCNNIEFSLNATPNGFGFGLTF